MSQCEVIRLLKKISDDANMGIARAALREPTQGDTEHLLAIARRMRNDNDELGALLQSAANGRGPRAAGVGLAAEAHASERTAPLATIGANSGGRS